MGPKWCLNYESGDYEWIDESGYSWDRGEYVYNWDRSAFDEEEKEEKRHNSIIHSLWDDDDEDDDW